MRKKSVGMSVRCVCVLCMLLGWLTGCATQKGAQPPPITDDSLAPVATMVESYGDIELPVEMVLDNKDSMAMRTDSFQGGIHVYRGRVEIASLKDYVIASMRNHKWKLVGEASYQNVMLAFTKPNKTCMVVLSNSKTSLGKTQANFLLASQSANSLFLSLDISI